MARNNGTTKGAIKGTLRHVPSNVTTPSPSLSAWAIIVSVFRATSASVCAMWFAFNMRANFSRDKKRNTTGRAGLGAIRGKESHHIQEASSSETTE